MEFTLPAASTGLGGGQNVLKIAWGFSTPLANSTVLNGILAYNKGMTAPPGVEGTSTFEPEVILSHAFGKRFGAFLDWDGYQDFNADQVGRTLKFGLEFQLGQDWPLELRALHTVPAQPLHQQH